MSEKLAGIRDSNASELVRIAQISHGLEMHWYGSDMLSVSLTFFSPRFRCFAGQCDSSSSDKARQ